MQKFNSVLLINDCEVDNLFIKTYLIKTGLTNDISVTENGEEAIHYLNNLSNPFPDLILLDVNMPVMDGFQFLDWFEESKFKGSSKVCMITAFHTEKEQIKSNKYTDVVGFIEKPINSEKILSVVNSIVAA